MKNVESNRLIIEPFIRNDQFNFIKDQLKIVTNGHTTTNDLDVLHALKYLSLEKVLNIFEDLIDWQRELFHAIVTIKDQTSAEKFLLQIKPYVIPFRELTDKSIKKLFPKVKKLKLPDLANIDLKEISYLGWNDHSSKKYIIVEYDHKLIGIQGTFTSSNKKGYCMFCHKFEEVGMFTTSVKGAGKGTFIKRGNYVCQDSQKCNTQMATLDKLDDFIMRIMNLVVK